MVYEFHVHCICSYVFALYFNFGISIEEIKIKIRTYFKSFCFKQFKNMVVENSLRVTINFYKKHCLPVVAWNKNDLSKQVVPIINTLERRLLQLLYFAVAIRLCELFPFRESKKNLVFFGLYEPSLDFHRREDQINTVRQK